MRRAHAPHRERRDLGGVHIASGDRTLELLKANLDLGVIAVLGSMSFLAVTFVIERYLYFARVRLEASDHAQDLDIALSRHRTVVANVASNMPYVGLLGTLPGILITFYGVGRGGRMDTTTIMVGLGLAFKATVLGLTVAVPSLIFRNALPRRVDVPKRRWRSLHDNAGTARARP